MDRISGAANMSDAQSQVGCAAIAFLQHIVDLRPPDVAYFISLRTA